MTTHETVRALPADDEWFDLEVNNNIDPIDMVISAGHDVKVWKYAGPQLSGKRILRVKLVRLGILIRDIEDARKRAGWIGCRLIEGQASEPFKAKFSQPDDNDLVIFGGSEWQSLFFNANVAFLSSLECEWHSGFFWSEGSFGSNDRWLVAAK